MATNARRPLRREPRQPRSRAMVERIIVAGQAVLLERGYEATTTNHIAAAAGISPGSLYQYFPDKTAILNEVIDRYQSDVEARVSRAFLHALGSHSRDAVRTNVIAILDAFEENPALLRVLAEQVPRSNNSQRATFARRIDELMTTAIVARLDRTADVPAEAIAWILVRTVEHVTTSYVLERPSIPRETVVDELTRLINGYLGTGALSVSPSRTPASPPPDRPGR